MFKVHWNLLRQRCFIYYFKRYPFSNTVPRSELLNRCLLNIRSDKKLKILLCIYISRSYHSSLAAEKFHSYISENFLKEYTFKTIGYNSEISLSIH